MRDTNVPCFSPALEDASTLKPLDLICAAPALSLTRGPLVSTPAAAVASLCSAVLEMLPLKSLRRDAMRTVVFDNIRPISMWSRGRRGPGGPERGKAGSGVVGFLGTHSLNNWEGGALQRMDSTMSLTLSAGHHRGTYIHMRCWEWLV